MHAAVRPNLVAGVALVSAGAIALSPVLPVPDEPHAPIAVRAADVLLLATPFDEYLALIQNSIGNLGGLAQQAVSPSPLPITLAVLGNQLENIQALGSNSLVAGAQFLQEVFVVLPGETVQAIQQFLSGDPAGSAETVVAAFTEFISRSLGPIVGTANLIALRTVNNAANAIEVALDNAPLLLAGATSPVYATVLASGQAAQNVINAAAGGDFLGVVGQTIAVPAVVGDGLLNGAGGYGGLLTPFSGSETGPVGALITYRNRIAAALNNPSTAVLSREAADPEVTAGTTVSLSVVETKRADEPQPRTPRLRELRHDLTGNLIGSRSRSSDDATTTKVDVNSGSAIGDSDADTDTAARPVNRPLRDAVRTITKQVTKALGVQQEKKDSPEE